MISDSIDLELQGNKFTQHVSQIISFLNDINEIVIETNENLEGNSFYLDKTFELKDYLIPKQLNLFSIGKLDSTHICEIGFNAGHSTFLILLGKELKNSLVYTIFDIAEHSYTKPCFSYIQKKFPDIKFEFIEGDSTIKMPEYIDKNSSVVASYDIIHLDGGHDETYILSDMKYSDILLKVGGLLIVDDTNVPHINKCVDSYIQLGKYTDISSSYFPTEAKNNYTNEIDILHRILQKIK